VLSRITRDFLLPCTKKPRRCTNRGYDKWRARLNNSFSAVHPFWKDTNVFTIEATISNAWRFPLPGGLRAVPYPTFLHPASHAELEGWSDFVRVKSRPKLQSLACGARGNRRSIIKMCMESPVCSYLETPNTGSYVDIIESDVYRDTIQLYLESTYCLQPPGDSPSRRGIFDALVSGCIPVVFGEDSVQYPDYFGVGNLAVVSVPNRAALRRHLAGIGDAEIDKRRAAVVKLIPRLVYGRLGHDSGGFGVAFRAMRDRIIARRGKSAAAGARFVLGAVTPNATEGNEK